MLQREGIPVRTYALEPHRLNVVARLSGNGSKRPLLVIGRSLQVPTMSTGATDMAYLRARGVQCFGFGPAVDFEDAALEFGAHSGQGCILERELHRFVRFLWDVVLDLAATPQG